ncbi:hypothetical protein PV04_00931 [Phialophora macrospora]|uniref:Uncharacterized protein n=1 Tax=Phialophora macrospora TaxID=1851006 RepID=A0A0D2D572_9EURO|nr:hypothetical protein PV04_00931 [Phialophora macrospora]
MATTTTVRTDHDVERAVMPVNFSQRPTLPISLVVCSARLWQSFRSFNRSFTLLQVVKFSVSVLVGTFSLVSARWALDLAMWTSVKDFREDCGEQLQHFNMTSPSCQDVLSRPLRGPPKWRGYLAKAAETLSVRSTCKYAVLEDSADLEGGRQLRRDLASVPVKPYCGSPDDAQDELFGPLPVGIRLQGDGAIMYGADNDSDFSFRFPLDEGLQDAHDELCDWYEDNRRCEVWLTTTTTGTIQDIEVYAIPDSGRESEAFEKSFGPIAVKSWVEVLADYGTALEDKKEVAITIWIFKYLSARGSNLAQGELYMGPAAIRSKLSFELSETNVMDPALAYDYFAPTGKLDKGIRVKQSTFQAGGRKHAYSPAWIKAYSTIHRIGSEVLFGLSWSLHASQMYHSGYPDDSLVMICT